MTGPEPPAEELYPARRKRKHPFIGAILVMLLFALFWLAQGLLVGYAIWGK